MQSRAADVLSLCSNILWVKMDFDYQKVKDAESLQRIQRLSSQPIHCPIPKPRSSIALETQPSSRKPPVKPRRSIKCRPTATQELQQPNSHTHQKESEAVVKRIAPSLVLGPAGPLEAQTPSLRAHILLWFQKTQLPRLQKPGCPLPRWLHGFATRREAEQLLQDKHKGCFLLRLSETKVGFVLSYRGADRCRHFIIEEESEVSGLNGQYVIAGENSRHDSLEELISYYTTNPVGPFNETLTVPCEQPVDSSDEITKLEVRNEVGKSDGEQTAEFTQLTVAENNTPDSSHQAARAASDSAQYAVVKKALKKTHSLPESKIVPDMFPTEENGSSELVKNNVEDLAQSTDAPYARVNKPPRAVQQIPSLSITVPDHSLLGAAASIGSLSFPSTTVMAEDKYWELEPLHTYEETPHMRPHTEEINFYAMGRRKEIERNAGGLPDNHLYSEVNIKGSKDDFLSMPAPPPIRATGMANSNPSSTRPSPSVPLRPPPGHSAFRSDCVQQSGFSAFPGMTASASPLSNHYQSEHLQPTNPTFSIYEQIPAHIPANSRPPLPPPNHKR